MDVFRILAQILNTFVNPYVIVLLLITDILSIIIAFRERKERIEYMERMELAARVYSREAYEFLILHTMQKAKRRVYCYWFSLNSTKVSGRYEAINDALAQLAKPSKNVDVRILTLRDPARLAAAYELKNNKIKIRFHESLQAVDLRFTLIDDVWLIFGLSDDPSKSKTPSREGIDVSGRKLAAILQSFFLEQWETAKDYENYAQNVVNDCLRDPTNSIEMVSEQLHLPLPETKRLVSSNLNAGNQK